MGCSSVLFSAPPPLPFGTSSDPRCPRFRELLVPVRTSSPLRRSPISKRSRACLFAVIGERAPGESWGYDGSLKDGFGGWSTGQPQPEKKKDFSKFLMVGVGTSVAVLIAAFANYSFSRNCFKLQFNTPFNMFHVLSRSSESSSTSLIEDNQISETKLEEQPLAANGSTYQTMDNSVSDSGRKTRIIVPLAADSTQQQALSVLKKLKIIENDVKSDELCTRREYARWLVKSNILLERNPKHKIAPSILSVGSIIIAFDDVSADDLDFGCIQTLGEVGIVPCKLSAEKSSLLDKDSLDVLGTFNFSPDSFLSRLDLVNWRAQLEYSFVPVTEEKMLRKKVDFIDVRGTCPDALPALFMDMLSGDKSIVRRVFGNSRRLQPYKPATKAQAAVALTSGRMAEAIRTELSRLEAENISRLAEMEEIRTDLLRRGEIQKFWEEKLNEEKARGLEVQRDYITALHNLEEEKMAREKDLTNYMKEKAALDCQRQLLVSLKEEIDEMYERLVNERANLLADQRSLEEQFIDLRDKQDAIAEAKSILEVEKEALRILRSWVEEEALQSQTRAKVLESAAQRWQWDDQFGLPQVHSTERRDKF